MSVPQRDQETGGVRLKALLVPRIVAKFRTQEAFADALGISKAAVNNWWRTGKVRRHNVAQASQLLGIPIEEIYRALGEAPESDDVGKGYSRDPELQAFLHALDAIRSDRTRMLRFLTVVMQQAESLALPTSFTGDVKVEQWPEGWDQVEIQDAKLQHKAKQRRG